jgi:WD40 repeat protein
MGAVYKAEHRLMERLVALKVLAPSLVGSPAMIERFRREVRAAALLSHPNIVTAHDAERAGELQLLVMEYVEGTDLARLVTERGPLPVGEACAYIRQAAAGLQHAHERNMIHRDIKPHNLMLTPQGVIKILDFGLARLAGDAANPSGSTTAQGIVLGTVDYMAPEQADNAHEADIRSDIYSLGCTLYHLLSGRPPFPRGTLVQKIMAHTERTPDSLAQLRPDLPPGLIRIVERMMAKAPGHRYQTPAEVRAALEPFAASTVTAVAEAPARPSPRLPHDPAVERTVAVPARKRRLPRRPWPRRRWPLVLGLLMPLLGGLFVLGVAVYRIQTDNGELVISTDNPDVEVIIKQNGKVVRILDTKTGKEVNLDSGDYDLELGGRAAGLKLSLDKVTIHRGDLVIAKVERQAKEVARWAVEHEANVQAVAFSPDGRVVLSATGDEGMIEHDIRLWDAATGKEVLRLRGHTAQVWGAAFSPDGKRILSCSEDKTLRLWDTDSGKVLKTLEGHTEGVLAAVFSPDGKRILSCGEDKTVRLWDIDSGKELRRLQGHSDAVRRVAFSPDGRQAISGSFDRNVCLWNLETGEAMKTLQGHTDKVHGVAFLPDGRQAISCAFDGTIRLWDLKSGHLIKAIPGPKQIHEVAFSPDGCRLLTAASDKTLRLWDIESGKELHRFLGHTASVNAEAFSPDGRFALSGGDDRTMRLWRLPPQSAERSNEKGKTGRRDQAGAVAEPAKKDSQELGESYLKRATNLFKEGRVEEAMAACRKALAIFEQLVVAAPKSISHRAALARADHLLGSLLRSTGRTVEAEAVYAKALALTDAIVREEPSVAEHCTELASLEGDRGDLLADAGKLPEAERTYRRALALYQKLVDDSPRGVENRAGLATTLSRLGRLLGRTGRSAEAEQINRRAQAIHEKLASELPKKPDSRKDSLKEKQRGK